jgi:hypothetical protein
VSYGSDTLGALDALARSNGPFIVTVTVIVLVWLASIGLTGWLAARRNREGGNWSSLAMFFGPFALVALLLLRKPAKGPALSPLWEQLERRDAATAADSASKATGSGPHA